MTRSNQIMYSIQVAVEQASDANAIEHLLDLSFGLSRRTKTSYRLREGSAPVSGLSFVVRDTNIGLAGAISFWPLVIGESETAALLLGPLAVHPQRQNLGIGRELMQKSVAAAKSMDHRLVILVGDLPYYERVGFAQTPPGRMQLPGPVNPARLLYLELARGSLAEASGLVLPPHRRSGLSPQ
jgi:predicted N-acetyltransferase YhbS